MPLFFKDEIIVGDNYCEESLSCPFPMKHLLQNQLNPKLLDKNYWETRERLVFSQHGHFLEAHKYSFTFYVEEKQKNHGQIVQTGILNQSDMINSVNVFMVLIMIHKFLLRAHLTSMQLP